MDDWAYTDCHYCGDYRKCYLEDETGLYWCDGEDCKHLQYINRPVHKWAVVYKDSGKVYRTFEAKGEANHCVTDCFGPEWHLVEIKELS